MQSYGTTNMKAYFFAQRSINRVEHIKSLDLILIEPQSQDQIHQNAINHTILLETFNLESE